ncbi:N-acetylmuramoyl-L-alanine amidase [Eubacteriales bacterium OttesenSCG-928-A19]|nr:N-acetylmuramoyl-L-alanine amidase [Eubacteriales bacterium OttesenSCG-928-A19]
MVTKPNMGVLILTQNDCYTKGRVLKPPTGIMVHASGANNPNLCRYVGPDDGILGPNKAGNHWNKPGFDKCGNAMIGRVADGTTAIYQTLPDGWRPWLSGKGANGNANDTCLQFEMLQDFDAKNTGKASLEYWKEVRARAVHLCAWWCQEFAIKVSSIISHREGAKMGIASNHGDPENWMVLFGDSMDLFRQDVSLMLNGGEKPAQQHYIGTVRTSSSGYINIRETPSSTGKIIRRAYDGERLEVVGDNVVGTFAPVADAQQPAFADSKYLVDRVNVGDPAPEPEPPIKAYTLTVNGYRDGPLTSEQAMNMASELMGVGYSVEVKAVEGVAENG